MANKNKLPSLLHEASAQQKARQAGASRPSSTGTVQTQTNPALAGARATNSALPTVTSSATRRPKVGHVEQYPAGSIAVADGRTYSQLWQEEADAADWARSAINRPDYDAAVANYRAVMAKRKPGPSAGTNKPVVPLFASTSKSDSAPMGPAPTMTPEKAGAEAEAEYQRGQQQYKRAAQARLSEREGDLNSLLLNSNTPYTTGKGPARSEANRSAMTQGGLPSLTGDTAGTGPIQRPASTPAERLAKRRAAGLDTSGTTTLDSGSQVSYGDDGTIKAVGPGRNNYGTHIASTGQASLGRRTLGPGGMPVTQSSAAFNRENRSPENNDKFDSYVAERRQRREDALDLRRRANALRGGQTEGMMAAGPVAGPMGGIGTAGIRTFGQPQMGLAQAADLAQMDPAERRMNMLWNNNPEVAADLMSNQNSLTAASSEAQARRDHELAMQTAGFNNENKQLSTAGDQSIMQGLMAAVGAGTISADEVPDLFATIKGGDVAGNPTARTASDGKLDSTVPDLVQDSAGYPSNIGSQVERQMRTGSTMDEALALIGEQDGVLPKDIEEYAMGQLGMGGQLGRGFSRLFSYMPGGKTPQQIKRANQEEINAAHRTLESLGIPMKDRKLLPSQIHRFIKSPKGTIDEELAKLLGFTE